VTLSLKYDDLAVIRNEIQSIAKKSRTVVGNKWVGETVFPDENCGFADDNPDEAEVSRSWDWLDMIATNLKICSNKRMRDLINLHEFVLSLLS
jgi:hypothetical protein